MVKLILGLEILESLCWSPPDHTRGLTDNVRGSCEGALHQPELLPLPAGSLTIQWVASVGWSPVVVVEMWPTVTRKIGAHRVYYHDLTRWAGTLSMYLYAALARWGIDMVLKTATLSLAGGCVICEILSGFARAGGLLLKALI